MTIVTQAGVPEETFIVSTQNPFRFMYVAASRLSASCGRVLWAGWPPETWPHWQLMRKASAAQ